jgi:hypothetical protein
VSGLSTKRPDVTLPPIDRRALMQSAHRIARQARPHMACYHKALAYGLRAAWGLVATSREFAALRAQVKPVAYTAEQLAASRATTRRCGASFMPFWGGDHAAQDRHRILDGSAQDCLHWSLAMSGFADQLRKEDRDEIAGVLQARQKALLSGANGGTLGHH